MATIEPKALPKPRLARAKFLNTQSPYSWACHAPGTFTRFASTPTLAYKRWVERNSRKGGFA